MALTMATMMAPKTMKAQITMIGSNNNAYDDDGSKKMALTVTMALTAKNVFDNKDDSNDYGS